MKLGSSNCLKFTEMVNYFIITLVLYHFNIFCDPITRSFLAPAGVGAQSAHSFCQNWAVSFKVLHALCMLTIVMQGQANLNVCTNKLARRPELLSSIKDENDNDAVALRFFRKR